MCRARNLFISGLVLIATASAAAETPAPVTEASIEENLCARTYRLALAAGDEVKRSHLVGMDRFDGPLAELRAPLMSTPGDVPAKVDAMIQSDSRKATFALEALLRIYEKAPQLKAWTKSWFEFIKDLEDELGWNNDARVMLKAVMKRNPPPEIIPLLEAKRNAENQKLADYLTQNGWLTDPPSGRLAAWIDTIAKTDWPKQEEDRKFILNYFVNRIDDIAKADHDMTQLQTGIHHLRRELRWLVLEIQALRGKVVLTPGESSNPVLKRLLDENKDNPKFKPVIKPTTQDVKDLITIPEHLVIALNIFIKKFGDIKEKGEMIEGLQQAYIDGFKNTPTPMTPDQAKQAAEKLAGYEGGLEGQYEDAAKAYQDLKDSQLLKALRDILHKQQ